MSIRKNGVTFDGAQVNYQQQQQAQQQKYFQEQQASQQRMFEQQRQAQERFYAEQKAQQQRASNEQRQQQTQNTTPPPPPPNNTGGSGGGRMSPNDYLPGRLSSQYDYRAEGNLSYQKNPADNTNLAWSAQKEVIPFGGGYMTVSAGYDGFVTETYLKTNSGDYKPVSHTTGHVAGNHHVHPDNSDKLKSYFSAPNKWYGKDGLLSQIIDKGPKRNK